MELSGKHHPLKELKERRRKRNYWKGRKKKPPPEIPKRIIALQKWRRLEEQG